MTEKMLIDYGITIEEYNIWCMLCDRGINAPLTHAAGRLFDSLATCLGISPLNVTYEGQAAIRLEAEAKKALDKNEKILSLPFNAVEKNDMLHIDWNELFLFLNDENKDRLLNDKKDLISLIALSFHKTVAGAAIKCLIILSQKYLRKT